MTKPERRDPDDLLAAFAQLTDRATRPTARKTAASARVLINWVASLAAVLVLSVIGSVVFLSALNRPAPAASESPRPSTASNNMVLPTHHESNIARGGTSTAIAGVPVVLEDDCLFVILPGHKWLVVWPTGTTLDESSTPPIVRDAVGRAITAVGAQFSMNGASYPADQQDQVSPLLDHPIPNACLGNELLLVDPNVSALGSGAATWRIDPAFPPDPEATVVHVLLTEQACASGSTPEGRVQPPEVDYRPGAIAITLTVLEVGGDCPSNPEYPLTVNLREPIGYRALLDGSAGTFQWIAPPTGPPPTPGSAGNRPFVTTWSVDAAAPVADATELHLLVSQNSCGFDRASVGTVLRASILYSDVAIEIVISAMFGSDATTCRSPHAVIVPTVVELDEPVGARNLIDDGVTPPVVRWRMPRSDAIQLPTKQTSPEPIGVPYRSGLCAGVGLDGFLAGAPDDPRLVWVQNRGGGSVNSLFWPAGFTVRFANGVEVLNEAGEIVHRGGEHVDRACVVGGSDELSLYGGGYLVLE